MHTGTILSVIASKGFGWIGIQGEKDLFFHASEFAKVWFFLSNC